jgi:hypothetical protein
MLRVTNIEKFFTPPKSPQKSDVNRDVKDSENNRTTLLGCRHFERHGRINIIVCRQFQFSYIKKEKRLKM